MQDYEFLADDVEININLSRKEIQDLIAIREPHIQKKILIFLDDVSTLYLSTAS